MGMRRGIGNKLNRFLDDPQNLLRAATATGGIGGAAGGAAVGYGVGSLDENLGKRKGAMLGGAIGGYTGFAGMLSAVSTVNSRRATPPFI